MHKKININEYEKRYPYIINDLLKYIEEVKIFNDESSLIDIVMEFALKKDIDVEVIGDAIKSDEYLVNFIKKDIQIGNLSNKDNLLQNW